MNRLATWQCNTCGLVSEISVTPTTRCQAPQCARCQKVSLILFPPEDDPPNPEPHTQ